MKFLKRIKLNSYLILLKIIIKKCNDARILDVLRLININTMASYIWYCPRKSCNAIVTKTDLPYLNEREKHICKRCGEVMSSERLFLANKRNLRKYVEDIENIVREEK